jgi:preprotein translocase subunit YajC
MNVTNLLPAAAAQSPQSMFVQFFPLILIFGIMYLLVIRPQKKKAQAHQALLSRLKSGDQVLTNGGIYGTVSGVEQNKIKVKIANNVEITIARSAIAQLITDSAAV